MKKRTAFFAVTFFLVQIITLAGISPAENLSPNPLTEIHVNGTNPQFKDACNILCMALSLYRSDAFARLPKEELVKIYSPLLLNSAVRFDLEHLDTGKKGWTRYYPFSVGDKSFIARVFLTKEAGFQQKVPVISEIVIENFGVTLQIVPGISEILNDCRIKPAKIFASSLSDKSA